MTTTAMLDNTDDHPEIWLEPKSDDYDSEGRMWCQDNQWGTEGVRYVRADTHVAGLVERLERRAKTMNGAHPVGGGDGGTYAVGDYSLGDKKLDTEAATTLLALSARAEAAGDGSDEAIMQERESCAFAVECHSGFGDPATIEACAQIIRDRSDPSLRSDSVHLTPERYAELLAAEARVKEMEAALEPFAAFADALSENVPDAIAIGIYADGAMRFGPSGGANVGSLRAARSLSPIKEAGK